MANDDDVRVFRKKDKAPQEHDGSKWSCNDLFGVPIHISELKALHPDSEVVEFQKAPRLLVVIREQISEEAAKQFVSDFQSRGVEVAVVCLGNTEALPERCIFGNVLESM